MTESDTEEINFTTASIVISVVGGMILAIVIYFRTIEVFGAPVNEFGLLDSNSESKGGRQSMNSLFQLTTRNKAIPHLEHQ